MSAARVRAGGAYVELSLTDNEFRKGLKRSEQAMKQWVRNNKKELAKMEQAFRQDMAKFANLLNQKIPKGLTALSKGFGLVANSAVKMGGAVNRALGVAGKGIDKMLAATTNVVSYQRVNKAIQMISHSVMQFGASMRRSGFDLLFSGVSVSLGLGSTLKDLTNLDKVFASIRGTIPMTSGEFEKLKKQVRKVGETSQFTANEVAEVALQLSKAGLALGKMDSKSLESLLRSMVGFGLASGIDDLSQLTEIAVQATGAFGALGRDSRQNVQRIKQTMNIMVAGATRSAMSVTDMFEAWKMAAPMAKQIGMHQTELAGLVGALADTGIKGTLAGTSLRRLFTNLAQEDKIKRLNEGLARFGQTAIDTKDMFGNLKNVSQIMKELAPKIQKLGTAARISLATEVFDVRGSNAALSVMESIAQVQKKTADIARDRNALARKQREMEESFYGLVKRTTSAFQELKLVIAEAMQPMADIGLNVLVTVINMIKSGNKVLERAVKTLAIVASSAAMLGAVMVTLGSSIMLVTSSLAALASVAIPLVGTMVSMAVAGERLSSAWQMFKGIFSGGLSSGLNKGIDMMAKVFDRIVDSIRKVVVGFNLAVAGLRSMVALGTVFGKIVATSLAVTVMRFASIIQMGASAFAMIFNPVLGAMGALGALKGLFSNVLAAAQQIAQAFSAGASAILNVTGAVAKVLGQMLRMEAIAESIKIAFGGIGKFIVSLVSNIQAVAPQLKQLAVILKDAVKFGDMTTAGYAVGAMFNTIALVIHDAIVKATDYMTNKIQEVFGPLIASIKSMGQMATGVTVESGLSNIGKALMDDAVTAQQARSDRRHAWLWKTGKAYKKRIKEIDEPLTPVQRTLADNVDNSILEGLVGIGANFMNMAEPIGFGIEKMFSGDFTDKIVGAILTLGNILTLGFANLAEMLGGIAGALGWKGGQVLGQQASSNLINYWKGTMQMIQDYEKKVRWASKVQDFFNRMDQFFKQAQRDDDAKKQKKKNEEVVRRGEFVTGLNQAMSLGNTLLQQGTSMVQDAAANMPAMPPWMNLLMQATTPTALMSTFGQQATGTKEQWIANQIDKARAKGQAAADAIAGILKSKLGGVNLSREAGGVGQSAAALAGTRYATIDMQQLGELKKHSEELKQANKRLKGLKQKPIKIQIR